jgi:tetratricopeptide (TPR) repeat protein
MKLRSQTNYAFRMITMLRNFTLFLLIGTSLPLTAQVAGGEFQKLFDWYAMEEYERCAYKAESYTKKDKYKKAPEPYMYLALCMYQAHINPDAFTEEFKDPMKDALKYAYKFRKKDKDGELYKANKRQIDQIRTEAMDRANFFFNDGDYYKASSEYGRILKVMPGDQNVAFITGVALVNAKNVTQGERLIEQALDSLQQQHDQGTFEKDEVTHAILIKSFVTYTEYLVNAGNVGKAQEVITLGRKLIPDDPQLKLQYKKLYALSPSEEEDAEGTK